MLTKETPRWRKKGGEYGELMMAIPKAQMAQRAYTFASSFLLEHSFFVFDSKFLVTRQSFFFHMSLYRCHQTYLIL